MIQFDYYFSNGLKPPTSVEIPYLVGKIEFDLNFYHSALWLNIDFRKLFYDSELLFPGILSWPPVVGGR